MSTVSHYFCIFCDFTCEEYVNAFNHYNSHMFVSGNCELCDYSKLVVYRADPKDLSIKCQSCQNRATNERLFMTTVIHYWINKFLSYQNKILETTYEKLLVANKVCVECKVCRYLLEKYESNGGDMNQIQYIRDNKVEHCYQHMRYDLKARRINEYIANTINFSRPKRILKVEALIEQCCDTFFTGSEQINNNSLVNIGKINYSSAIQDSDNECLSCSENTETISQLSPSFEDTLQQSLAPILAKLNIVESEIADTNSRIERNDSDPLKNKNKIEKIETNIKSDSTLDYFANTTASLSVKLSVVESELNTIKSERNEATPAGTVAYFASPNAPSGWLKADGQTVSRVKYSKLFVTIGTTFGCGDGFNTFNLPDLRGEFIRGWSDGRDVDKTRAFGSFQWGSSIPIGGNLFNGFTASISEQNLAFAGVSFDNSSDLKVTGGQTRDGITYPRESNMYCIVKGYSSKQITSWNALKGTRPRNFALLACIKY